MRQFCMSQNCNLSAAKCYREKFTPKALRLFKKILTPSQFENKTTLHVLVIGAGNFPSYHALLEILTKRMPHLTDIFFVLVEPMKSETDFFLEHFAVFDRQPDQRISPTRAGDVPTMDSKKISTHFSIHHGDLKSFLKKPPPELFDLIYFEHPETLTMPILLAKIGIARFKRITALREAIPFLTNVIKKDTIIIGSCMSRPELKQLESLLNFSLGKCLKKTVSNPLHIFYGGPYSEGICVQIQEKMIHLHEQQKCASLIRLSDNFLCIILLLALVTYIIYCSQFPDPNHSPQRLAAILLIGTQLYLHRPGKNGLFIKLSLYIVQLAL